LHCHSFDTFDRLEWSSIDLFCWVLPRQSLQSFVMPHVRSASARIMRRALAVQNGYCVHLPVRLPLEGLVPPTCLPPPGLERATADLVLDYLLLRDPPVVKCSLEEEEEADITTVSENLSCRMQASESLVDVGIGVQASESLVDVGVQTVDARLAEEEVEATVATISETLSCRSLVDSGVQTDDACLTVLPKEEAAVTTHSEISCADVVDFHCEVGCQTESVVGMEGGASGVLLGKVTVAAEEELEAPSSAESSPNVQSDSDSRALSGASQGCLNRPVTLNGISNPGSDAFVRVRMDVSKTVRQSEEEFQAVPPDSKRSDGKGDVRGHRKGRGKGQRYHSSAKPAKSSKGANIVFDEVYRFGRTLTDCERRCKSQVWPLW